MSSNDTGLISQFCLLITEPNMAWISVCPSVHHTRNLREKTEQVKLVLEQCSTVATLYYTGFRSLKNKGIFHVTSLQIQFYSKSVLRLLRHTASVVSWVTMAFSALVLIFHSTVTAAENKYFTRIVVVILNKLLRLSSGKHCIVPLLRMQ